MQKTASQCSRNAHWIKGPLNLPIVLCLHAVLLWPGAPPAQADFTCGGRPLPGSTQLIDSLFDHCGNGYSIYCVDNDHFRGQITNATTHKSFYFGECKYAWGV